MMNFIIRLVVNGAALWLVPHVVAGVHVNGFTNALIAAFVLGIVNAILKPILVILSLPLEILTLGLFTLVINACLFYLVAQIHALGLAVDDFGSAFLGALILSIVSFILSLLFKSSSRT
jgi:putative membrane protein